MHAVDAWRGGCRCRRRSPRAWLGLAVVPLLGSLITEPAAMTIAALMLAPLGVPPRHARAG